MMIAQRNFCIGMAALLLSSCAATNKQAASRTAVAPALTALIDSLPMAHVGVLVQQADGGKVLHAWNANRLFVPASNTKLLSMYAGLKYLPDTLPGLHYFEQRDTLYALPTGDPTLLASDYKAHPVINWLQQQQKPVVVLTQRWRADRYGRGWPWSDYQASYQPERSLMPVLGNIMPVRVNIQATKSPAQLQLLQGQVSGERIWKMQPEAVQWEPNEGRNSIVLRRDYTTNKLQVLYPKKDTTAVLSYPFVTNGVATALDILRAVAGKNTDNLLEATAAPGAIPGKLSAVASQPLDSMLRPMMHRSDNLFAEQTLLMASGQLLGYLSDRQMVDTLLKTELKAMPDVPVWADGSGLSRYNLFSPANFVWLLQKMKDEFGPQRVQHILPTGNKGTLTNYYKPLEGKIFAKTGTLSGQVALSGYLYASSGRQLLFSVLVNNHNMDAPAVRRHVERFLMQVYQEN